MTDDAAFTEQFVAADGFRIRCMIAGNGPPLLHLHGAGGLNLSPGIGLLARKRRVIACEMPGFGGSAENTRATSTADLAASVAAMLRAIDIERCDVLATSFGARVALWLAINTPSLISTLVLESPAAIRPAGQTPPTGTPDEIARMVFAHPERQPPRTTPDPTVQAKNRALVMRIRGPDRDAALETAMTKLALPVLVLFGTRDRLMPPELGRHYKELLPNGHLVFVYDAGHAISAERPEAFADIVADFLERHEAFVINGRVTLLHP